MLDINEAYKHYKNEIVPLDKFNITTIKTGVKKYNYMGRINSRSGKIKNELLL